MQIVQTLPPGAPSEKKPRNPDIDIAQIPAILMCDYKRDYAIEKGIEKNILLRSYGGFGDEICAEATIRFALETFKDVEISLETFNPEIFGHLKFKKIYDRFKGELPNLRNYYFFDTIASHQHLAWHFICHLFIHCVDAACLYAFRSQLPKNYLEIKLEPNEKCFEKIDVIIRKRLLGQKWIVIHPGKHWPSKTFPKWWWDFIIYKIKEAGYVPVLIGGNNVPTNTSDMIRTTVEVDIEPCLDLRCQLSLMESVALLKRSSVVLTNDSCVLHMAAATDAWIGFLTLAKDPQHLTHYRKGQFGWRMENLSLGGLWQINNLLSGIRYTDITDENMKKWLPQPEIVAQWAIDKMKDV